MRSLLAAFVALTLSSACARAQARIGAQNGSIALASDGVTVWVLLTTPQGTFTIHADSATMAIWADSASALRTRQAASRASYVDSSLQAAASMAFQRLSTDSLSPYQCTGWYGKRAGSVIVPFDSARRLFEAMRNVPRKIVVNLPDSVTTFYNFQVQKHAVVAPGSRSPTYPGPFATANVSGKVLAQFVVDTTGHVDISTFRALSSTHPVFTLAVYEVLPDMRFHPAQLKGAKVRELIQEPYAFTLR